MCGLAGCQFCDRHLIANPGQSEVIRVRSGDRYYFDLEENTSTGYSWRYVCDNDDVEVRLERKEAPAPKRIDAGAACGAPGKASVRIRIHRGFDGPAVVRFFYQRPWEEKPARQFTIALYKRTGDVAFWK